jgi:hypothetical protein
MMKRQKRLFNKFWLVSIILITSLAMIITLIVHDVSKTPNAADRQYIQAIYPFPIIDATKLSFDSQVVLIQSFQKELHRQFIIGDPIAYYQTREPKDLINNKEGRCYDFSRTIEKFLMLNSLEVRHVAIYQVDTKKGRFFSFLRPQSASHSLTEVRTRKGWMIVDSNFEWIGLDTLGNPKSFCEICEETQAWKYPIVHGYEPFFTECPIYIYGLYSRHGCFYPPYSVVPDLNFRDLVYYNLF